MSFTSTDGIITEGLRQDVQVMPFHARLNWHRPYGERTHLMVGAGYVHTEYGDDANASGDGAGLLLGFRYQTLEKLSFRFEATADWYSDTDFTAKEDHVDYGVQFGFSGLFGGGPGDGDKDGVTDDLDRCPETPRGEAVDANGCPLPKDSDGDGVMDDADKCPDTPQGEKVDANGCPLPKDSDGDGVLDNADKCPNTPRGEKVDRNGCPLPKDSDGDGVIDDNDKCPGTPAGTKVDKNGCPQLFEESKATLVLEGVNFETAKAELTPGAREVLDRVAVSLAAYPEIRVEVAGHTDNKGSRALQRAPVAEARRVRARLPGRQGHRRRPHGRQGLRPGQAAGHERHRRGSRAEPAHGAEQALVRTRRPRAGNEKRGGPEGAACACFVPRSGKRRRACARSPSRGSATTPRTQRPRGSATKPSRA